MKKYSCFIVVPLLVSLFIYLFYRTEKMVVNQITIRMISFDIYAAIRKMVNQSLPLTDFIIYSLPEGLWVFSLTLASRPLYILDRRINSVIVPLIVCLGLEMAQLLHFTNGQFDLICILTAFVFWFVAVFAFSDKLDKQNILNPLNGRKMVCFALYGTGYLSHVFQ